MCGGGKSYNSSRDAFLQAEAEAARAKADREAATAEAERQRQFDREQADIAYQREQELYNRRTAEEGAQRDRQRQQTIDDTLRAENTARENREREQAAQAAREAEARHTFTHGRNVARDRVVERAREELTSRGVDPAQYDRQILAAAEDQYNAVPDLAANPAAYFNGSFVDSILSGAQSDRRKQLGGEVNRAFAPNSERGYFNDDADDNLIESIIGGQYDTAVTNVNRARDRGNLDDTGVAAALARLGEQRTAGRSLANSLGGAVISANRDKITNIGNRARDAASSFNFGDDFNLGSYTAERDSTVNSLRNSFEGDVRNAIGGQNFFNIDDVLAKAGGAQGAVNPQAGLSIASADALAERDRQRNTNRGVGGGGSF